MSEALNETDHELRALLRFASGIGLEADAVQEIYATICREADEAGGVSPEYRMAEAKRRMTQAAG